MLNETQRVEMGRGLAAVLLDKGGTEQERINNLFQLLACRDASKIEQNSCSKLIEQLRKRYLDAPEDAERLLSVGEVKIVGTHPPIELAVWAQLATTVLASDVAILLY